MKMIDIGNWFNPKNIEHIEAYIYLQTFGIWPEDFIPEYVHITNLWQIDIISKLGKCWLEHMLKTHNDRDK